MSISARRQAQLASPPLGATRKSAVRRNSHRIGVVVSGRPSPPAFAGAGSSPLPRGEGTGGSRFRVFDELFLREEICQPTATMSRKTLAIVDSGVSAFFWFFQVSSCVHVGSAVRMYSGLFGCVRFLTNRFVPFRSVRVCVLPGRRLGRDINCDSSGPDRTCALSLADIRSGGTVSVSRATAAPRASYRSYRARVFARQEDVRRGTQEAPIASACKEAAGRQG